MGTKKDRSWQIRQARPNDRQSTRVGDVSEIALRPI